MSKPEIFPAPVPPETVRRLADETFGDMIKFVVDVETGAFCAGGGLHSDEEALLLENGSAQENLWGGNYYPDLKGEDRFEYKSMINIRPDVGNPQQELLLSPLRKKVREVAIRYFETSL